MNENLKIQEGEIPKVSVLMPVYNTKEEYLREAIESVLNQTFTNFEFLIINDDSTNNVEKVIKSYKDIRIKYLKNDKNLGIAKTRNKLMELAKGEYLALVDSDDISLATRFEKQVKFLDENLNFSIVGAWFKIFPRNQIIKNIEKPKCLDMLQGCCLAQPVAMFRKKDFEKYNLKYCPEYETAEDYDLWVKAIKFLNFYNLQEVLLLYRKEGQNTSVSKAANTNMVALKIQKIS